MNKNLLQLAIVLSLFLFGCSSTSRNGEGTPPPEPIDPDLAGRGQAYYAEWGCADCHGEDREGIEGIPAVADLRQDWNVDDLASYLEDPVRYSETNPRIRELQERYPDFEMPAYDFAAKEDRRALAAWLLSSP